VCFVSELAQVELGNMDECMPLPRTMAATAAGDSLASGSSTATQGLTLVHGRAQLEQLQDTLISSVGSYGGKKSSS